MKHYEHISKLVANGFICGYYPYWEISFNESYRSWQFSEDISFLISEAISMEQEKGEINTKIKNKSILLEWNLEIGV